MINSENKVELSITRIFDAPRELVWMAWTDVKHLKIWWGPKGFTNPVCEWVAQAGKKILIHMKAPNGITYPMDGEFTEVVDLEKLVFKTAALDDDGKRLFEILNTIQFSDDGGKTKIRLDFVAYNITPAGKPYLAGQEMGWNMSLDKLVELLKQI